MFEVIRWISLGLIWMALGMNIWSLTRCIKARKFYESARDDYIELAKKYHKLLQEEVADEGNNDDNG